MTLLPYDLPMSTNDRVTRAEAAEILGVGPARVDVLARGGLLTTRVRNRLTNRTTYNRAEVEALARKRAGMTEENASAAGDA